MKKLLLLVAMVAASFGAKGQCNLSFGPKIGLNVSGLINGDCSVRGGGKGAIFAQYRFYNSCAG